MADLTTTLLQASQADKAAEQRLNEWVTSNYGECVQALTTELATEGKPAQARHLAAIFLKNTLNGKSLQVQLDCHSRWKQLKTEIRQVVKDGLLQAMRSAEPGVANYCATTASEVAAVELPYNEWPTFVPTLTENVSSPQAPPHVQQAALQCLGYTCERIADVQDLLGAQVPELPTETVDTMLTTIVNGVQKDKADDLRFAALTALKNSLLFVSKNMQVQSERDFILRNAMMEATRAEAPKLRSLAFMCLDQVVELYYEHMADYMKELFTLTTGAIQSDPDEDVQRASMEFWSTVAVVEQTLMDEEEDAQQIGQALDRPPCNKYTHSALATLVPILLEKLKQQDENQDDDDIGIDDVAAMCIQTLSQTVEAQIIPIVMPFVTQNIAHTEWRLRDAAIVAFTCILDGPDTKAIGAHVSQSIGILLKAFHDPHETVRQSAVHCLANICRLHAMAIPGNQVHVLLQALLEKMTDPPKVAAQACTTIYNIARSLHDTADQPTNLLSQPLRPLLQGLLQANDRPDADECNLRGSSLEACGEVIGSSAMDVHNILCELLPTIVDRVDAALSMPADDMQQKSQLLGLLCIIYNALFRRLAAQEMQPYADRIMNNLLQILQIPTAECHDEAFMAIGALADVVEGDFVKYMEAVMPLVIRGIQNFEATALCKVSLGTLVDISVNVQASLQPYCDQLLSVMMDCLKSNTVHRSVKPVVISGLGDIALAICGAFEPYLQVTSMLLMQAAQQQAPPEDEEMTAFINELRVAVLEAYAGILIGLEEGQKLALFFPDLQNIMPFLQFLSAPTSNCDETVLVKAVTLLGDIARIAGKNETVRPVLQQPFVMQLLTQASSEGGDEGRQVASWAHQHVQAAISG